MYPGFDIGIGDAHAGLITAQPNLTPEFPSELTLSPSRPWQGIRVGIYLL